MVSDAPSRKGISSSLVRSAPRARAMVERRWIAFKRRRTSSCWTKSTMVYCHAREYGSPPYLELVDEDGNGIELVARTSGVGHGKMIGM